MKETDILSETESDIISELLKTGTGQTSEVILKEVTATIRWSERQPCSDWRSHVPLFIANLWEQLSLETRLVVYSIAEFEVKFEP